MATRAKGKVATNGDEEGTLLQTQFVMQLKKEGIHVAHYHSDANDDVASAFKDSYMPHDYFVQLQKPTTITVTITAGDTLNG
jgi:hypothetical protein